MEKTTGFCINPVSKRLSSARSNAGANRAADHGTHRTTNTGTNSRTSLSPGPATSSRDSPRRHRPGDALRQQPSLNQLCHHPHPRNHTSPPTQPAPHDATSAPHAIPDTSTPATAPESNPTPPLSTICQPQSHKGSAALLHPKRWDPGPFHTQLTRKNHQQQARSPQRCYDLD